MQSKRKILLLGLLLPTTLVPVVHVSKSKVFKKNSKSKKLMYATSATTGLVGLLSFLVTVHLFKKIKNNKIEMPFTENFTKTYNGSILGKMILLPIFACIDIGLNFGTLATAAAVSAVALPVSVVAGYAAFKMKK